MGMQNQTQKSAESATTLGGYGEIGYNAYLRQSDLNRADAKRFSISMGHRFNDQWSAYSEMEWEHAVASAEDVGETEIEQMYLNYQVSENVNARAGLILIPSGLLNLTHEPPLFSGVERNFVETRIIPTTWREGGLAASGATESGWAWDIGLVTGFDLAKLDDAASPLAGSHQELSLAHAEDFSMYAALNYRGLPGLTAGASLFAGKTMQGNADHNADPAAPDFSGIDGALRLSEAHACWQSGGWTLQGLGALGILHEAGKMDVIRSAATPAGEEAVLAPSAFYGWYLMAGRAFRFRANQGNLSVTPFARYEQFDAQLKMPDGFAADPALADRVATAGFSVAPHPQIVVKADYQRFLDHPHADRIDLGLGFMY